MTRRRRWLALIVGLVLAAVLWFGAVPAVTNFIERQHGKLQGLNPALVDAVTFGLNIALLIALVGTAELRRRSHRRAGGEPA